jgi:hypothetical protein
MKRFSIALLGLVTALAICPSVLFADNITISFASGTTGALTTTVTAVPGSISFTETQASLHGLGGALTFNDGGTIYVLNTGVGSGAKVIISTGAASSYLTSGSGSGRTLTAVYGPGADNVVDVEVDSSSCTGGAHPGVCFMGDENQGDYTARTGSTGSFGSALFDPIYVSPYILLQLGDAANDVLITNSGADSFGTRTNAFLPATGNITSDKGPLNNGEIDFQTLRIAPEPSSLLMFGSGLLGLAGLLRFKFRKTS